MSESKTCPLKPLNTQCDKNCAWYRGNNDTTKCAVLVISQELSKLK